MDEFRRHQDFIQVKQAAAKQRPRLILSRPPDKSVQPLEPSPQRSRAGRRPMAVRRSRFYFSRHKVLSSASIAAVGIAILAGVIYVLIPKTRPMPPLPASTHSQASFPVYYLGKTVKGYSLKVGSAHVISGILFYTLKNHAKGIYVTEQNAPPVHVNLSSLPKYSTINLPAGQAVIGTGLGNPSIVIMAPATLIELTSNKFVTKDDLTAVAQQLRQQ